MKDAPEVANHSAVKKKRGVVLAQVNNKGGCGKTTTTVSLSAALADMSPNMRVCLVDLDPQCDATLGIGVSQKILDQVHFTSYDLIANQISADNALIHFKGRFQGLLSAIPGHDNLTGLYRSLDREVDEEFFTGQISETEAARKRIEIHFRLKQSLEALRKSYDVIVIDTPPTKEFLMATAVVAADYFIIPVFPSAYDLKGLAELTNAVEKTRENLNPSLQMAGILLGGAKPGYKGELAAVAKDTREKLKSVFGDTAVFDTVIMHSVRNAEAPSHNETILEYDPKGSPSAQFRALAKEFVNRAQKTRFQSTLRPLPDFKEFAKKVSKIEDPSEILGTELAANV